MRHAITSWYVRFKRFIQGLVAQLDQAICAREEERACRRGWQIIRTGFGRRRYRDPRFDLLKSAGDGSGSSEGVSEAEPTCPGCGTPGR
ncbi:MAG: hypothetical protein GEV03_24110 [Streptosporangiales bacterium]|nr:hypothetical protein [Streptosporangiales bacterium]